MKLQRAPLPFHTVRRWTFINQEAGPHQTLNVPTLWSWTSQPPCPNIRFCYLSHLVHIVCVTVVWVTNKAPVWFHRKQFLSVVFNASEQLLNNDYLTSSEVAFNNTKKRMFQRQRQIHSHSFIHSESNNQVVAIGLVARTIKLLLINRQFIREQRHII